LKKEEVSKFIIFESSILDDLNHRQAILMGLLNGMAKKEGYAYLKNATICELLKASESTVKRDLQLLEQMGYIRREVIRNEKKEVIQRRIYPMVKFDTKGGGNPDTEGMCQTDTKGGGQIDTIDNNKDININNNIYDFENAWSLYGKVGNKQTSKKKWKDIKQKDKESILKHIPVYIKNHKDNDKLSFIPHFTTYLNQRRWEDNLPYKEINNTFEFKNIATLDDD
jgi:DNA-binding Lrp family transcriptional regulator